MEAKANAKNLQVATKDAIEVCNFIRGKTVQKSKMLLQEVIEKKRAVPYRRSTDHIGHKKGIGPGKYPEKVSTFILKLLEQIEINAQNKGMDTATLYIKKLVANKGSKIPRYGRRRGRKSKRTHIEIVAEEKQKPAEKKATK